MNAVNMLNWAPRVGFVCVGSPRSRALIERWFSLVRWGFVLIRSTSTGACKISDRTLNDDGRFRMAKNVDAFIISLLKLWFVFSIIHTPDRRAAVNWSEMSNKSCDEEGISKQSGGFRKMLTGSGLWGGGTTTTTGWWLGVGRSMSDDCLSSLRHLPCFIPLWWWSPYHDAKSLPGWGVAALNSSDLCTLFWLQFGFEDRCYIRVMHRLFLRLERN